VHLLNPVAANVCSRGNADSIISFLVVLFLWLLLRRRWITAGLAFGTAVHMKLYPVIFALPVALLLGPPAGPSVSVLRWLRRQLTVSRIAFATGAIASFSALFAVFYALCAISGCAARKQHPH
jgi:phosphatidylinositol glycan class M